MIIKKRIERTPRTDALYLRERQAVKAIREAAEELLKLLKIPRKGYWRTAIPTELYTILDSFGHEYSIEAASEFLALKGFVVKKVGEPFESGKAAVREDAIHNEKTPKPLIEGEKKSNDHVIRFHDAGPDRDESDAICPCGDPDCSRPFGHPEGE